MKRLKKIFTLTILVFFIYSFILFEPLFSINNLILDYKITIGSLDNKFLIPYYLGKVTKINLKYSESDIIKAKDQPVIINIQDLHCNPEVQRNISEILKYLDSKYCLKNVYVEGAYGDVDTSWLCDIKDAKLKSSLLESLINSGRLTGGEHYSVISNKPNILKGIENEELHKENIKRLAQILDKSDYLKEKIFVIEKNIRELQKKYFNQKNINFNKILNRKSSVSEKKYYNLLINYVKKIKSDSFQKQPKINLSNYPNLLRYINLLNTTNKLSISRVNIQLKKLLENFKTKVSYSTYCNLIKYLGSSENISKFILICSQLSKDLSIDLDKEFPELKIYFNYVLSNSSINPIKLLEEERELIKEIRIILSENISELEISFLVDFLEYLRGYLTASISAENYYFFNKEYAKFKDIFSKYSDESVLTTLQQDLNLMNIYFETNIIREQYFIENIFKYENITNLQKRNVYLQESRNNTNLLNLPSSTHQINFQEDEFEDQLKSSKIVVVITGGFHSAGIGNILERYQIPYLILTPNAFKDNCQYQLTYQKLIEEQAKISTENTSDSNFEYYLPPTITSELPPNSRDSLVESINPFKQGNKVLTHWTSYIIAKKILRLMGQVVYKFTGKLPRFMISEYEMSKYIERYFAPFWPFDILLEIYDLITGKLKGNLHKKLGLYLVSGVTFLIYYMFFGLTLPSLTENDLPYMIPVIFGNIISHFTFNIKPDLSLKVEKYKIHLQKLIGILSKSDIISDEEDTIPDFSILTGNPDMRAYVEYAKWWVKRAKENEKMGPEKKLKLPYVFVAAGRGRGTLPLVKSGLEILEEIDLNSDLWKQKKDEIINTKQELENIKNALEKNLDSYPSFTEALLIKKFLELFGIPEKFIGFEQKSTNVRTNFEFSKEPILSWHKKLLEENLVRAKPIVAIVTFSPLLSRCWATAQGEWADLVIKNGWRILRHKTHEFDVNKVSLAALVEIGSYLHAYPEQYAKKKNYKGLNTEYHEIRGLKFEYNPSIRKIPSNAKEHIEIENIIEAAEPELEKAKLLYEDLLNSLDDWIEYVGNGHQGLIKPKLILLNWQERASKIFSQWHQEYKELTDESNRVWEKLYPNEKRKPVNRYSFSIPRVNDIPTFEGKFSQDYSILEFRGAKYDLSKKSDQKIKIPEMPFEQKVAMLLSLPKIPVDKIETDDPVRLNVEFWSDNLTEFKLDEKMGTEKPHVSDIGEVATITMRHENDLIIVEQFVVNPGFRFTRLGTKALKVTLKKYLSQLDLKEKKFTRIKFDFLAVGAVEFLSSLIESGYLFGPFYSLEDGEYFILNLEKPTELNANQGLELKNRIIEFSKKLLGVIKVPSFNYTRENAIGLLKDSVKDILEFIGVNNYAMYLPVMDEFGNYLFKELEVVHGLDRDDYQTKIQWRTELINIDTKGNGSKWKSDYETGNVFYGGKRFFELLIRGKVPIDLFNKFLEDINKDGEIALFDSETGTLQIKDRMKFVAQIKKSDSLKHFFPEPEKDLAKIERDIKNLTQEIGNTITYKAIYSPRVADEGERRFLGLVWFMGDLTPIQKHTVQTVSYLTGCALEKVAIIHSLSARMEQLEKLKKVANKIDDLSNHLHGIKNDLVGITGLRDRLERKLNRKDETLERRKKILKLISDKMDELRKLTEDIYFDKLKKIKFKVKSINFLSLSSLNIYIYALTTLDENSLTKNLEVVLSNKKLNSEEESVLSDAYSALNKINEYNDLMDNIEEIERKNNLIYNKVLEIVNDAIPFLNEILEMPKIEISGDRETHIMEGILNAEKSLESKVKELKKDFFDEPGLQDEPYKIVNLKDLIKKAVSEVQVIYEIDDISFMVNIPDGILIKTQPSKFYNYVIKEFLRNACKYMLPPDKQEKKISISAEVKDDGFVYIKIEDTGMGLDKDRFNKLFNGESFARPEVNGIEKVSSSGVGFPAALRIMHSLGGDIPKNLAKSVPGVGTTFVIVHPVVPAEEAQKDFSVGALTQGLTIDNYLEKRPFAKKLYYKSNFWRTVISCWVSVSLSKHGAPKFELQEIATIFALKLTNPGSNWQELWKNFIDSHITNKDINLNEDSKRKELEEGLESIFNAVVKKYPGVDFTKKTFEEVFEMIKSKVVLEHFKFNLKSVFRYFFRKVKNLILDTKQLRGNKKNFVIHLAGYNKFDDILYNTNTKAANSNFKHLVFAGLPSAGQEPLKYKIKIALKGETDYNVYIDEVDDVVVFYFDLKNIPTDKYDNIFGDFIIKLFGSGNLKGDKNLRKKLKKFIGKIDFNGNQQNLVINYCGSQSTKNLKTKFLGIEPAYLLVTEPENIYKQDEINEIEIANYLSKITAQNYTFNESVFVRVKNYIEINKSCEQNGIKQIIVNWDNLKDKSHEEIRTNNIQARRNDILVYCELNIQDAANINHIKEKVNLGFEGLFLNFGKLEKDKVNKMLEHLKGYPIVAIKTAQDYDSNFPCLHLIEQPKDFNSLKNKKALEIKIPADISEEDLIEFLGHIPLSSILVFQADDIIKLRDKNNILKKSNFNFINILVSFSIRDLTVSNIRRLAYNLDKRDLPNFYPDEQKRSVQITNLKNGILNDTGILPGSSIASQYKELPENLKCDFLVAIYEQMLIIEEMKKRGYNELLEDYISKNYRLNRYKEELLGRLLFRLNEDYKENIEEAIKNIVSDKGLLNYSDSDLYEILNDPNADKTTIAGAIQIILFDIVQDFNLRKSITSKRNQIYNQNITINLLSSS